MNSIQLIFQLGTYYRGADGVIIVYDVCILFPIQLIFQLWHRSGASCDIQYKSLAVQIFNLFFVYIIPIFPSLGLIAFCIRHVSSIRGVRSQQIINLRRKHQRTI